MSDDAARLARIDAYIEALFVPQDDALRETLRAADAAGLPLINVSANQGKLLYLLTRISGARRVLEIGTLGGYSTAWLARGLAPGGRLITLELDAARAELARRSLARSVPGIDVEVKVGAAAETLRTLIAVGEPPFDLVFIDADKPGYVEYLSLVLRLSRPGTVILADNVIRDGRVLDPPADDANAVAARRFNAVVAAHPRLESLVLPVMRQYVDGLSMSIVTA
jgi:predicted O-methyltransferase YrrM